MPVGRVADHDIDQKDSDQAGEKLRSEGGERSLQDLGTSLGVTAERVRQIESRALGKLRHSATHH